MNMKGEVKSVLDDRAASYRMFSRLFLKPLTAEDIEGLSERSLESQGGSLADTSEEVSAGVELLSAGFNDMGRGLHRRHTGTQRLLSTDFTMCFDGVSSFEGLVAVPYASIYNGSIKGDKAVFFQEPRANDLAAYRREHIAVDASLHLPEDHLSFEMSFMADLSDKMGEALQRNEVEEALRLVEVSQTFLSDNILSWYGSFYERALSIVQTRFYRGVLKATFGYLLLDQETLGDLRDLIS